MIFTYENQGTNTYLVYKLSKEDKIDTLTQGMLTHNKIPGLAAMAFSQVDTDKFFKYNVTARISAKQFFSGAVNKKRLIGVFSGIIDAMLSAEDYMIEPKSIILDMDYIFADVSTCETVLICLPVRREEEDTDLALFFKTIMFSTQFDQTENCDHVAKIINYLNSAPTLSLVDFRALLKSLMEPVKQAQTEKKPEPARQTSPAPQRQPVVQAQTGRATVLNQQQKPVSQVQQNQPSPIPQKPVRPMQPVQPPQPVIPPQPPKSPVVPATSQVPSQETEEADNGQKMSFMYLMRHYSKENAELYKAQKEGGKTKEKPEPEAKGKKDKKAAKDAPARQKFEMPGTVPAANFAVPGQQAASASFTVPGGDRPVVEQPPKPVKPSQPVVQKQAPVQPTQSDLPSMPVSSAPGAGGKANFGETTILNAGGAKGETMVLNATNAVTQIRPFLIRSKNNEKILVDKPVYRIGKERSYVDYFIGDNSAISRSHANILSRDGDYFIIDTNSTNHTFVNGAMIQSNVETPISNGDRIRLANEEFEFRLT